MSFRHLLIASLLLAACAKPDGGSDTKAAAPAAAVTTPPAFDLARVDKARQMGSETAKVWFIRGSDFECPWCKRVHDDTLPQIQRDYVQTGKIRVAFMNHP